MPGCTSRLLRIRAQQVLTIDPAVPCRGCGRLHERRQHPLGQAVSMFNVGRRYGNSFSTCLKQDATIILLFAGWMPGLLLLVPPIVVVCLWRTQVR